MKHKDLSELKRLPNDGVLGTDKVRVQVFVEENGGGHIKSIASAKEECRALGSGGLICVEVWTLSQVLQEICVDCLNAKSFSLAAKDNSPAGDIDVATFLSYRETVKSEILALQGALSKDGWEIYKALKSFNEASDPESLVGYLGFKAWGRDEGIREAISWNPKEDSRIHAILGGLATKFRESDPFLYSEALKTGESELTLKIHPELREVNSRQGSPSDVSARFVLDLHGLESSQISVFLLLYGIGESLIVAPSSVIDYLAVIAPSTAGRALKVDIDNCSPQVLEALSVLYEPSVDSSAYGTLKSAYEAALAV